MYISRHRYLNKKGFSLIEFIVSFGIISIVISTIYSMLFFSMNSSSMGELYDEILLNGRYGIEYIKEEVKKADKIIPVSKIKLIENAQPNNLGFVILQESKDSKGETVYRYICYYLGDKNINRVAYTKNNIGYPNKTDDVGYNIVCDYVLSIEGTNADFDKGIINLDIAMGLDKKVYHNYKSTIAIRCPIDN